MIPVYQPFLTGKEKEYVNQCIDSSWISSKGEFITRFEDYFSSYIHANHATTVINGTVALHLGLITLGIGPGDEVIAPSLTYIASINTILQTGATPVFADSLLATWQIDPDDIRCKITSRTKAIMAVHLYGLPCDMDAIMEICQEFNLFLIEDCAEAFGAYYKGRHVGTFGDVSTFSFFGNKTITTGEGGMVVTKTKELFDIAFHLKTQGVSKTEEYWHDVVGYNYRMTNICAAIGLAQLEQADEILNKKREITGWYKEGLSGLPLTMHSEPENTRHSFWMCSILMDNAKYRLPLRQYLKEAGIETRSFFYPAHILPHCKQNICLPVADDLSARGINLPSSPTLSPTDVAQVCEAVQLFFYRMEKK